MATIPAFLDGLGPTKLVPTLDPARATTMTLSAEEGFVLSRVDGRTSLGQIIQLVPFDREVTIGLLRRLWLEGAVELPGVARPQPKPKVKPISPSPEKVKPNSLSDTGRHLLPEQELRIEEFYRSLDKRDAFQLLEVPRGADDKEIKRAYFKLSKEFHPDRHYGKELGDYRAKLSKIFLAVKDAFELLSDKERRTAYEESASGK